MMFLSLWVVTIATVQADLPGCERQFTAARVIDSSDYVGRVLYAADIDGDGDTDVVAAAVVLVWYENDGSASAFTPHVIADVPAISAFAADFDGDGDADILAASYSLDSVYWYENIDGRGRFGPQRIISTQTDGVRRTFASDLDADGDYDVVSVSEDDDKVAWYENVDGLGGFGPQRIISTTVPRPWVARAGDVDGDGDTDVVSASSLGLGLVWHENIDGLGAFARQHAISRLSFWAADLGVADMDGDGDLDAVAVSSIGTDLVWYENLDGRGSFGYARRISHVNITESIVVADLDGDGDQDVAMISADPSRLVWYENTDSQGTFGPAIVVSESTYAAAALIDTDLDGDGDVDLVAASPRRRWLAWFENETDCNDNGVNDGCDLFYGLSGDCNRNGLPDDCELAQGVDADCNGNGVPDACEQDCIGSGRPDVCDIAAGVSEDCNGNGIPDECDLGKDGIYSDALPISTQPTSAPTGTAADLDGDGDVDILTPNGYRNDINWYENLDGNASFGPRRAIPYLYRSVPSLVAADLDGDGDADILATSFAHNQIAWFENTDGKGAFATWNVIADDAGFPQSSFAADLDGDGDLDVLAAIRGGGKVVYYENTDGLGSFGSRKIISNDAPGAHCVLAADLDGDEDLDVLWSGVAVAEVAWHENVDGLGTFSDKQVIWNDGGVLVIAADLDGDGDADVLSVPGDYGDMVWFENTDGAGTFGEARLITTVADRYQSADTADVDGDGDIDIVAASHDHGRIVWFENTDGLGTFSLDREVAVMEALPLFVFAVDLDGDNDDDLLWSSELDGLIAWYENKGFSEDCNDNGQPDECDFADGRSIDCNENGIPDECEPEDDSDGDGVFDVCDLCPDSQLGGTLDLHGCDTGIAEIVLEDGCTMTETLGACDADRRNHGDFVHCVTDLAGAWKRDRIIKGREYGRIVSCAARGDAGKTDEHGRGRSTR